MKKFLHIAKYTSLFCIIISISLLSGLLFRRYTERQKQLKIFADFEAKVLSQLTDKDHIYTGGGTSDYTSIDGQTIAILRLDRLNIKVSVAEGTEKDTLRISAGHFPETSMPGEGNFAIAGHSSLVYTCLFNDINLAVPGDVITVTTRAKKHQYIVTDTMVVEPTDVELIGKENESLITIVTCTNSGKERLIIRGIET